MTRNFGSMWRRAAIGALAVAILGATGGYLAGANRDAVSLHSGKAYSTPFQISITGEDGWVYDVPLDMNWTDGSGTWHQGGRPDCLPPTGELTAPVTFAATEVTVNGVTWRPVVWVSCRP
jgi:hypothetical protein